jgi:hypothetical protein
MPPHELAERRSIRLHAAVAERLLARPVLLEDARARVAAWRTDATVARMYAEEWADLLDRPLEELAARLVEPSERMHDLRQVSPFAGILDARTRWRVLREGSR